MADLRQKHGIDPPQYKIRNLGSGMILEKGLGFSHHGFSWIAHFAFRKGDDLLLKR